MKGSTRGYLYLALLLILSGVYWLAGALALFDGFRHGTSQARMPFDFAHAMRTVSGLTPEAAKAGAHVGDTLLEIGGRPFTGIDVMRGAVAAARPGEAIAVKIRRASDGAEALIAIPLAPRLTRAPTLSTWIWSVAIELAFPLFCLCLGFWVAAARPRDRNAWLLLAIMISLSFLLPVGEWKDPWIEFCIAWNHLCGASWPIWMMLFGVYFPERAAIDRRLPWIKWVVAAFVAVPGAAIAVAQTGQQFDIAAVEWLAPALLWCSRIGAVAGMVAIAIFFALLSYKSGSASSRDTRRRLRLVWAGATAGLTPSFIVSLISLFSSRDFESSVPGWFLYFALACLTIFPLTLAYVIVVQRAMEVRVVLRQSAQYALARGALWLLRALVVAAILTIVLNIREQEFHPITETALVGLAIVLLIVRQRYTHRLSQWMDKRFFREAYNAEQLLSELSNEARNFVETKPLLDTVTRRISETLHVPRISVLLSAPEGFRLEAPPDGRELALVPGARSIQLLRSSHEPAVVYFDDPDSWLHEAPASEREALKELDAQLLLPLSGREDLLGVMALGPKRSEEPYSKADLQLLQSVASQTGLALENGRLLLSLAEEAARRERFNHELEIAREVQERLFPQTYPSIESLDCAGRCRSAQGVGGDYYDFIPLAEGRIGIAVGDVSGKGIPAALLMASLRASLRGQTIGNPGDLAALMRNVNALLYEASASSRYATFFYAQYDPASRRLDFVNAGHNPPLVLRGAEVIRLEAGGPVVGLLPSASYEQKSMILGVGDLLCAYTDGISEAMTSEDEEWGEERMIEALQANLERPAARIIDAVIDAADRFTGGAPQHDDMTLVLMKVLA